MSDASSSTPEGWYPDPDGTVKSRWWDGTAWTEHYHDPSAPVDSTPAPVGPAVIAAPIEPGPVAQQAVAVQPSVPIEPAVPGVTSPYNLWIWFIVGLLGLSLISQATFDFTGYVLTVLYNPGNPFAAFTSSYVFLAVVGFLVYWATVALAFFDYRDLRTRGVPAPFHWAFAFISSLVYLVGRSMVIRRRLGNGLVPLWVSVGYVGAFVILVIAWFVSTIVTINQSGMSFP